MSEMPVELESTQPLEDSQVVEADPADDDQTALCCRCGHPLTMDNLAMPKSARSQQGVCKACVAVTKMLQRNLGEIPEMLDATEQQNFFRRCLELRGSDGNPLRYKQVRTELKQCMVLRTTHTRIENSGGTYQPLSWYEKQGYNTEDVESKADCRENPVLGPCYLVPLLSINESKAREQVEETLVQMERQVKRRRIEKVPTASAEAAPSNSGGTMVPDAAAPTSASGVPTEKDLAAQLVELVSDSEDEGDVGHGVPKPTTAKQQAAMERRAKAKAQAAEKKKAEKDFRTVVALSNKAFIVLRSLIEKESKCEVQITKSPDSLEASMLEKFGETCQTTKKWFAEAQSAMKKVTGGRRLHHQRHLECHQGEEASSESSILSCFIFFVDLNLRPQLLHELDFDLENAREVLAWFAPVYCDCSAQTADMEKTIACLAAWRAGAGKLEDDWVYNAQETMVWTKETMVEKLQQLGHGIGRKAIELRSAVRWLDAIQIHCTPYFQDVFLGASVALKDLQPHLKQMERMLQTLVDV
eukprot:s891_g20.t1